MHADTPQLESWESWPLWALGLSNGTNIALWYVLSMARIDAPELPIRILALMASAMPLIITVAGLAAAVSLDGVLIATIAGMRHGRRGLWSILTIIGACGFSASIAYAVHAGMFDRMPLLHVAQAIVLAFYNLHLSQPKRLTPATGAASPPASPISDEHMTLQGTRAPASLPQQDGFKCSKCGAILASATAVRTHQRRDCPERFKTLILHRDLPAAMQPNGHDSADDAADM